MKSATDRPVLITALSCGLLLLQVVPAWSQDKPKAESKPATAHPSAKANHRAKSHAIKDEDLPDVNLLEAASNGAVILEAEGTGDGKMNLSVTNNTNQPLKVVLPPGLIASGATGQMMGMGGMGGMGGGMGMMGGMGGMGGGMMGGGMGGMGGMRGGMGGGMMGGRMGMGGGTMPASMGMMMLGRLIMMLVGDMSSWNFRSLMMGSMMGGMGMGMGGMGGMMGGMGGMGGMMGGMGGGFRSVPPTGEPYAVLQPGQAKKLPTRLVSLGGPSAEGTVAFPAQGEKLTLGDVSQLNPNPRVAAAVRRLAEEKAPTVASQLVLWNVAVGLEWDAIARLSQAWATPKDVALARQFVASLDDAKPAENGKVFIKVEGDAGLADALKTLEKDGSMLGLKVVLGIPETPTGPSLALAIVVDAAKEKAEVAIKSSTGLGKWVDAGKLTVPVAKKDGKIDAPVFTDAVADGLVGRVIEARLVKGKKVKGHDTYTIQFINRSPLVLNGLAVTGAGPIDQTHPKTPAILSGLCVGPSKYLAIGTSAEAVERLGLKAGVHVLAADLSSL